MKHKECVIMQIAQRKTIVLVLVMLLLILFTGCGVYKCDRCGKTFLGDAYYDSFRPDDDLCEDCAKKYYAPFPYTSFVKTSNKGLDFSNTYVKLVAVIGVAVIVGVIIKKTFTATTNTEASKRNLNTGKLSNDDYIKFLHGELERPVYKTSTENEVSIRTAEKTAEDHQSSRANELDNYKNRVEKLKIAKESGLISDEEYEKRVAQILNEI